MKVTQEDLQHIKSLLMSSDQANIQIGLNLCKNIGEAALDIGLGLWIIYRWASSELSEQALEILFSLNAFESADFIAQQQLLNIFDFKDYEYSQEDIDTYDVELRKDTFYRQLQYSLTKIDLLNGYIQGNQDYVQHYLELADYCYNNYHDEHQYLQWCLRAFSLCDFDCVEYMSTNYKLIHFNRFELVHDIIHIYELALKQNPLTHQRQGVYNQLANQYYEVLKDYDKAIYYHKELLKINPLDLNSLIDLGIIAQEVLKDNTQAEAYFRKGIQTAPNDAICYNNLAYLLINEKGRHQEAEDFARKAIALEPKDSHCQHTLGYILWKGKKAYVDALHNLKLSASLDGQHIKSRLDIGDIYLEAFNDKEEAKKWYKDILLIEQGNTEALKRLSKLH